MKINKYFLYMAIGAAAAGFTACGDDYEDYQWAPIPEGSEVYFSKNLSSTITLSSLENTFSIPVMRADGAQAGSYAITATAADEKTVMEAFTIPSTANFAAGETETDIVITYDFDKIDFDNPQSVTLTISEAGNDNTYGAASYSFKATIPAPWTEIGQGIVVEEWWTGGTSSKVTFYQNDIDPTSFRVTNPFAKSNGLDKDVYFEFRIIQAGETLKGVTVTRSDLVYFPDYQIGHHDSYDDDLFIMHPSRFTSLASEEKWVGSYVESYQGNGLPAVIKLSPCYYMFNNGGWTSMLTAENVTIVFPGIQLIDASIDVTYNGLFKSAEGESNVVVGVELGPDVESAELAVVKGCDPDAAVADIIAGKLETVTVTEAGEAMIPFDLNGDEGRYTIVAVSYNGDKAQESASSVFFYTPAKEEQWNLVGTGTYNYDLYWEGDEEGLELYQSESDPTLYKIAGWSADGGDLKFTVDADGKVTVLDQEIGETYGNYGMVYIGELADYTEDPEDGRSYFKDGVYHFSVAYYVGAGALGDAEETFVLDKGEKARSMASSRTVNKNLTVSRRIDTKVVSLI